MCSHAYPQKMWGTVQNGHEWVNFRVRDASWQQVSSLHPNSLPFWQYSNTYSCTGWAIWIPSSSLSCDTLKIPCFLNIQPEITWLLNTMLPPNYCRISACQPLTRTTANAKSTHFIPSVKMAKLGIVPGLGGFGPRVSIFLCSCDKKQFWERAWWCHSALSQRPQESIQTTLRLHIPRATGRDGRRSGCWGPWCVGWSWEEGWETSKMTCLH